MKLSDAILKGCEMSPTQLRCQLLAMVGPQGGWASCALGAAYLGYYGPPQPGKVVDVDDALFQAFPMLSKRARAPAYLTQDVPLYSNSLYGLIAYLNDGQKLTREEIALQLREKGL